MISRLVAFACRCILLVSGVLFAHSAARFGILCPPAGWIALAAGAWQVTRRRWISSGNFGTARLATLADAFRWRLTSSKGWVLGRLNGLAPPTRSQAIRSLLNPFMPSVLACRLFFAAFCPRWGDKGLLRVSNAIHAGTFAPAGAGKSTRVLVPNLLSYAGNCVVVDPKGELFELTAEHRRKHFGHQIVRLDPAMLCGPDANRFNPLDLIDPHAADFLDKCRDLANQLVVRSAGDLDPHWNDSAETVLAAFIAYVRASEPDEALRNLRNVRTLVASRRFYKFAVKQMRRNEGFGRVLQQLGGQLDWFVDRELGSVMTTVQRHTAIFDSPLVAESTRITDWNPSKLRNGKMTVYLTVPADKLVIWSPLVRAYLGGIIRSITQGKPTEKCPVLFLVDEAAHIGRMRALEDAITLMRGMGLRVWLFFQSLNQLNAVYQEAAGTILDNLATQQYFGLTSYETAEAVANRIGDETIINTSEGDNDGWTLSQGIKSEGRSRTTGTNRNHTEGGRKLLFPSEILQLPKSTAIVFHQNCPPILCETVEYFADREFRKRLTGGFGTGRSSRLGLSRVLLTLMFLAWAGLLAVVVASLPPLYRPMPRPSAVGYPDAMAWPVDPYDGLPAPPSPLFRRWGRQPLPYSPDYPFYP